MSPPPPSSNSRPPFAGAPLLLGPPAASSRSFFGRLVPFVPFVLFVLLLSFSSACRPETSDTPPTPRSAPSLSPLTADQLSILRDASTIYWRHSQATGETVCEPWTLRWTDEASTRATLERQLPSSPPTTLRLGLTLVDEHLHARHPQIEHNGALRTLPCALAGRLELEERVAQSLDLAGPVSWFFDREACLRDDSSQRVRPLGCPSVLADLRSRERLVDPPSAPPATTPAWLRGRRVFLRLERSERASQCLSMRRHDGPEGAHHGLLNGRAEDWTIELSYHFDGSWLTLSGPTWRQRHGRGETVVSRGCLLSDPVLHDREERGHFARVGWFTSRRECEAATMDELAPRCLTAPPGDVATMTPPPST